MHINEFAKDRAHFLENRISIIDNKSNISIGTLTLLVGLFSYFIKEVLSYELREFTSIIAFSIFVVAIIMFIITILLLVRTIRPTRKILGLRTGLDFGSKEEKNIAWLLNEEYDWNSFSNAMGSMDDEMIFKDWTYICYTRLQLLGVKYRYYWWALLGTKYLIIWILLSLITLIIISVFFDKFAFESNIDIFREAI